MIPAHAKAAPVHYAVSARYDADRDLIDLEFEDELLVSFPRKMLQGLADVSPEEAATVELKSPGTNLYWPALDVAHDIPGLLDGVFHTRRYMAELGARVGAVTSDRKDDAARENGKKGGRRPKKGAVESAYGVEVTRGIIPPPAKAPRR